MLRLELGFYVGCLNLHDRLARKGEPTCFPEPLASGKAMLSGRGLYDLCLSLSVKERVVGNDVSAGNKLLVVITGANRAEVDVLARHWPCPVDDAVRHVRAGCVFPCQCLRWSLYALQAGRRHQHEEREAGRRAKQNERNHRQHNPEQHRAAQRVVRLDKRERRFRDREANCPGFVGKRRQGVLRDPPVRFGAGFHLAKMDAALFLRAERLADGRRTFRLVEGEPLPTSYGEDLYRRIFGAVRPAHEGRNGERCRSTERTFIFRAIRLPPFPRRRTVYRRPGRRLPLPACGAVCDLPLLENIEDSLDPQNADRNAQDKHGIGDSGSRISPIQRSG